MGDGRWAVHGIGRADGFAVGLFLFHNPLPSAITTLCHDNPLRSILAWDRKLRHERANVS